MYKNMQKVIQFFKEVHIELKKVAWPSKEQTIHYTVLVVIISIFVAIILGLLDSIFGEFISNFIFRIK